MIFDQQKLTNSAFSVYARFSFWKNKSIIAILVFNIDKTSAFYYSKAQPVPLEAFPFLLETTSYQLYFSGKT